MKCPLQDISLLVMQFGDVFTGDEIFPFREK